MHITEQEIVEVLFPFDPKKLVVLKMCVKMHGHKFGGLLKSRDLISPFGLLEELQMVFLASLLLRILWPSLLPKMKLVAKSKE